MPALSLGLQAVGMSLWYWSFVKDTAAILANGYKGAAYSWPIFVCGLICCVLGTVLFARRPCPQES